MMQRGPFGPDVASQVGDNITYTLAVMLVLVLLIVGGAAIYKRLSGKDGDR